MALQCLPFLSHQRWVDQTSIDVWMLSKLQPIPESAAFYVPSFFINPIESVTRSEEEIATFRKMFGLPPVGVACPLKPIVYILNCAIDGKGLPNHFCVVICEPKKKMVYLLGSQIKSNRVLNSENWDSWNGHRILTQVLDLMGWDKSQIQPSTFQTISWVQNGYDCGPIACHIAEDILRRGVKTDQIGWCNLPKFLPCYHPLRQKMVQKVYEWIKNGVSFLRESDNYTQVEHRWGCEVSDYLPDLWKKIQEEADVPILNELRKATEECVCCRGETSKGRTKHLKDAKWKGEYTTAGGNQKAPPAEAVTDSGTGAKLKPAAVGRFPRSECLVDLVSMPYVYGHIKKFEESFDDYHGGPTLEDQRLFIQQNKAPVETSLAYICDRISNPLWTTHRDYGYRLLPDFTQIFNRGEPVMVKEHTCPVGLPNPPPSIINYHHPQQVGRNGQVVSVTDTFVVGAEELLDMAVAEGDKILLTGKTGEKYICVDLLKDAIKPQRLAISCDLDSIIWITKRPRFRSPIGIFCTPEYRDKPPIFKNNHIRIELLLPKPDPGARQEWYTVKKSLSNIPNILFGKIGQSTSTAELVLFFPRMVHQDPVHNFWINKISNTVQNIFWDCVVLPAISKVNPISRAAYFPSNRFQTNFNQDGSSAGSVFPVSSARFTDMVQEMENLVSIYLSIELIFFERCEGEERR
jgi:hypothetical protein